jgi:D-alanyl-D-alanine carboxypeptidase
MTHFFQNLFEGKIIKDEALLKEMHTFTPPKDESTYCHGLMKIDFFNTTTVYYHGDFGGTGVACFPEYNAPISAIALNREKHKLNAEISLELLKILEANQ